MAEALLVENIPFMDESFHDDDQMNKPVRDTGNEAGGIKQKETKEDEEDAPGRTEEEHVIDLLNERPKKPAGTYCWHCTGGKHHDYRSHPRRDCPAVKEARAAGRVCKICFEAKLSVSPDPLRCEDGNPCYYKDCDITETHCSHACADWDRCDACAKKVDAEPNDACVRCWVHHCDHKCVFVTKLFARRSLGLLVVGLLLFLWDITSDMNLAVRYFRDGDVVWGGLTLALVIVAGTVMSLLNVYQWKRVNGLFAEQNYPARVFTIGFVAAAFLFVTPMMWVVTLMYLWKKGREFLHGQRDKFSFKLQEKVQSSFANSQMVEAFVEAAPQFLLQLFIIFSTPWEGWTQRFGLQLFGVVSALLSLSWTLVCLYCAFHQFQTKHPNDVQEKVIVLLWQLFFTIPRFLAMGLFASVYQWYILIFFFAHTTIVFLWHFYCTQKKNCKTAVNSFLVALISNFGFNPKLTFYESAKEKSHGSTHGECYWQFYLLVYIENVIMVSMWFYRFTTSSTPVPVPLSLGNNSTNLWRNATDVSNTTVLPDVKDSFVADAFSVPYWLGVVALVLVLVLVFGAYCIRYAMWSRYLSEDSVWNAWDAM